MMENKDEETQIGKFLLGKTIGSGSFSTVRLATHAITHHQVAVKILTKSKFKELGMQERVQREINILRECQHPHIIRLYETFETDHEIFLIQEYASNGELYHHINKGNISPKDARAIFQQILCGVEYCHAHNVAHRDLKPENLLLDSEMHIKIADFGFCNEISSNFGTMETPCGSPHYAAPEVISGRKYHGPEADVWSCGVILYTLLEGFVPFYDESTPKLFNSIRSGKYKPLSQHVGRFAHDLIRRMLEVDPRKRITIAEIRAHPWFQRNLPDYLRNYEFQKREIDYGVVEEVLGYPFVGMTRELVERAVALDDDRNQEDIPQILRDLRCAYELLLDEKHTRLRIAESNAGLWSRILRFIGKIFSCGELFKRRRSVRVQHKLK